MIFNLRWLLLVCVFANGLRADFAKDLTQIHAEATGGRERVAALKGIRATGTTTTAKGDLGFVLCGERPNRLRIDITTGPRQIVQAWDGRGEPWTSDSKSLRTLVMAGEVAAVFKAEAEFDDPLLAGPDRPVSLDYGGEVEIGGRTLLKVVVTQNFTSTSFLYLDPVSYLIVRRDVLRRYKAGVIVLSTEYSDFRPVAGVLLPHRLVVNQDGRRLRETVIDKMEPNPTIPAGYFSMPAAR